MSAFSISPSGRVLATIALFAGALLTVCKLEAQVASNWVSVPMILDNNKLTIEVTVTSAEGKTETVRAWVDTGNPDLWVSSKLADRLGLWHHSPKADSPLGKVYLVETPRTISVSGFQLNVPRSVRGIAFVASSVLPGLNAEMNIPASVLSQAEVEFDYPDLRFGVGFPGNGNHQGVKLAVFVDHDSFRVELPATIDGETFTLGLDTGSGYSWLDQLLMNRLLDGHPEWPHLQGYLGPSNSRCVDGEQNLYLARIPHIELGPIQLAQVGFDEKLESSKHLPESGEVAGALGGNVLKNFRIDIDYASGVAYFDKAGATDPNQLDMVGLVLRPEADGSYSVCKEVTGAKQPGIEGLQEHDTIVSINDRPVSGMTLGQVIDALSGQPGQMKKLVLRDGNNTYTVTAIVRRYLPLE